MREGRYPKASVRRAFLTSASLLALAPAAAEAADLATVADFEARWGAWGELGGTYGTEESSFGELIVFAPLWQDPDSLLFSQVNAKYFETQLLEGNFALGLREMTASGFNLGAWAALDVAHTGSENTFGQVSFGLEALSSYVDARVNGYLPFTGPQTVDDGIADVVLEGNNIFMIGGEEVALYGVDAEIGARLPFAENKGHLAAYGGGFWFDHDEAVEAITGGKARVELAFNDVVGDGSRISAQYEFTHDGVRGDRHLVGAYLRLPIGPAPAASSVPDQWLRMQDRIERDDNIVFGQSDREQVADGYTDVRFDQVAYANDSATLVDGINTGANTLIILDGANNPIEGGHTLMPEQTLLGGDGTLRVYGIESGAVSSVHAPGSRPMIAIPGNGFALTLSGSNTVDGVDIWAVNFGSATIDGATLGGIDGTGTTNIAIVDTDVVVQMEASGARGTLANGGNGGSADNVTPDGGDGQSSSSATATAGAGAEGGTGGAGGPASIANTKLYGLKLTGASDVQLIDTNVTAQMSVLGGDGGNAGGGDGGEAFAQSGNGGNGGNGGNSGPASATGGGGNDGGTGGSGGDGTMTDAALYGIDLEGASDVLISSSTVFAEMVAAGGDGGDAAGGEGGGALATTGDGGAGLSGPGGDAGASTATGGSGGDGGMAGAGGDATIAGGTLYGINLDGASDVIVHQASIVAAIDARGGRGGRAFGGSGGHAEAAAGSGGDGFEGGSSGIVRATGGAGGAGGTGGAGGAASNSTRLYGISLLDDATNIELSDTGIATFARAMGGDGGDADGGFGGGARVTGGDGGDSFTIGSNAGLAIATAGAGGVGGEGGAGGEGLLAEGGVFGLGLEAEDVDLSDVNVTLTVIGVGGSGGDAAGGDGGRAQATAGKGGDGVGNVGIAGAGGSATATGGVGGAGGEGGAGGLGQIGDLTSLPLTGIDVGSSMDVEMADIAVTVTASGLGGSGGSGTGGAGGEAGATGGAGGASLNGSGGAGGSATVIGGDGGGGDTGGAGGIGRVTAIMLGVGLDGASDIASSNTDVTLTAEAAGGAGGDASGGAGGNAEATGGAGGTGATSGGAGGQATVNLSDISDVGFGGPGGFGGAGGEGLSDATLTGFDLTGSTDVELSDIDLILTVNGLGGAGGDADGGAGGNAGATGGAGGSGGTTGGNGGRATAIGGNGRTGGVGGTGGDTTLDAVLYGLDLTDSTNAFVSGNASLGTTNAGGSGGDADGGIRGDATAQGGSAGIPGGSDGPASATDGAPGPVGSGSDGSAGGSPTIENVIDAGATNPVILVDFGN